MPYEVRLSRVAVNDVKKLTPKLRKKLREIIQGRIAHYPYEGKRLVGDLAGFYSMRMTLKDRVVYSIDEEHGVGYIHRARTHYGG